MATKGMETVSTNQIISSVAAQYSDKLPKKVTKELLVSFLEAIEAEIISGKKARIDKLGVMYAKERAARRGRNPQTGEEITIPASKKVAFRPAKSLRDAVGVSKRAARKKK
jgi:DNA-binding protein HU-beta